ncbi:MULTISPECIES: hypothetical protein [Shewanella]|uniref:Lipoprotein n=1 Tax=Shewanella japonica TaxID=93973 RepID=A0ABM6JPD6_9GAMM|nr:MULTISPECIES: hypothetical protein [Shewanella]ARD24066.1 hypothetical protein SJ2017_3832 [Shewanella japonica]KPZ68086.1 hypothetical protein AN944_03780 [Shewanella sp. P1-14-1]MBQ4891313.1 hypothetical protein [Shewanella sp. MMG014]OBT09936.1 hypothetical protein A9267_20335 [Shewanella sp. UCD-FRSSP16_17]
MNTKVLTLLVLCLGIFSLSGCIRTPEWTLFYYADQAKKPANPIQADYIAGYYDTLEQCQLKGDGMLRLSGKSLVEIDKQALENATAIPVAIEKGYQCEQLCQVDDENVIHCQ